MDKQMDQMEEVIDLRELFWVLVANLKWILLAMAVGGALAFSVTWLLIPSTYTSEVSLYVNNQADGAQPTAGINIGDLNASQRLVSTYRVILQDNEVMKEVIARLLESYDEAVLNEILPMTPDNVRSAITMSAVDDTEVLQIKAETQNAELSALICTIMTEIAPPVLERVVKAGSVEVIGQAEPATSPSSPSFPKNTIIGILVGAFLVIAIVLVRYFLDDTVKDAEDIKKHMDLPILGEIPNFDSVSRGEGYHYG